jgi:hypothetical protein
VIRERSQFVRQGEDHMNVGNCEKLSLACGEPLLPSVRLAFRAMAVTACNGELSITCLMGSLF